MIPIEKAIELGREHKLVFNNRSGNWDMVMLFRQLSKNLIIESSWGDYRDGWEDFRKPDFWQESTFNNCIEYGFDFQTLQFTILFWQGNSFDGLPEIGPKRKWIFQLTQYEKEIWNRILIPDVENYLIYLAGSIHEKRMRELEEIQINAIYQNLIK